MNKNNLKIFVFLIFSSFIFVSCLSKKEVYEGIYDSLKDQKNLRDSRFPQENSDLEEKDQTYQEYIDEVEKSKF